MRAVIQRVLRAQVSVGGETRGSIDRGLLVFLGITETDTGDDIAWLSRKLVHLRIFEDADSRMNESLADNGGDVLLISQFTLYGHVKKGTRPSFNRAAPPDAAVPLYKAFIKQLEVDLGKPVPTGEFGAMMNIEAEHDGPVTIVLDTEQKGF